MLQQMLQSLIALVICSWQVSVVGNLLLKQKEIKKKN